MPDASDGDEQSGLARDIAAAASSRGLTLAVAESLTGGLLSGALAAAPSASRWFRGALVAYSRETKHDLLAVPDGPVVSAEAASAMAHGVRRLLRAEVGLAVTGAGGPDPQDDRPPGTVFIALAGSDGSPTVREHCFDIDPTDPARICAATVVEALRFLHAHLGAGS